MTKTTIFNNKITSSILLSLTLATIIAFSMPQAEAHTSIVTESSKTQEVGTIIIYVGFVDQFVGSQTTTFSVSCDSPAIAGIAPTAISGPGEPFVVKVTSSVAGTFDCTITAKLFQRGALQHTDTPIVTSTFSDALATCEEDLGVCEGARDAFEFDLGVCEGDLGVCEGDLGVCEGERDAFEFDLGVCGADLAICTDDLAACQSITIEICHDDEETLSVSAEEIAAHTAHGDELGPCDDDDDDEEDDE